MLDAQPARLEHDLRALARQQAGCQALMVQYGMGELSALVTLCELGDVGRLHASRQAVRLAGIDIGVHRSDRHAQLGKLTRQGSAPLRWALFEAAQSASYRASRDYADYHALKARGLSHTRATLTIARKLARRSYQILRELGPAGLEPPATTNCSVPAHPSPMRPDRAASSRSDRGTPTPRRGGPQRPSGRRRSTGTTDRPSRHRPPPRQPRAQIRQGVHGASTQTRQPKRPQARPFTPITLDNTSQHR